MKKRTIYFVIGLITILLSTPLAYKTISIVYINRNLADEYVPLLNGFIHSFILIGVLIFSIGLVNLLKDVKSK